MQYRATGTPKQTILLILFAFSMLIVMLTVLSAGMPPGPSESMRPIGYVLGGAAILGSAFLTSFKLRPSRDTSWAIFQTNMLMCLAFSELGSLLGFVWHLSSGIPMWPLSVGSLTVNLLLILPRVLAYIRLQS